MAVEITPMKQQYYQIKEQYPDCVLFFRLGDFYEMFDEDARRASRDLELTLTTRDRGKAEEEQTPMCGVPYHSAETYIARLIQKGYKVAICEQTEDPAAAKGLVSRDVIRVITPGTVTESSMLDEGRSNYICAVFCDQNGAAAAFCDVSTGELCAASFTLDCVSHVVNELTRFSPREALLSQGAMDCAAIREQLAGRLEAMIETGEERFDYTLCAARLCEKFAVQSTDDLGLDSAQAVSACGALIGYIAETQRFDLSHIRRIEMFQGGKYMELDWAARRSLEITENLRTGEKRGSLLWVLDKTKTPMGGRLLRSWCERPLLSPAAIRRRLAAVGELAENSVKRGELIAALSPIGDMQRLIGRAVYGSANGRDLMSLAACCESLPRLKALLEGSSAALLREAGAMDPLSDVRAAIQRAICDEPPFSVREGGILRAGYSEEVDRLRDVRANGARMLSELEARERERTGVKKLKVGYNKVFGYYIDIPNSAGAAELPGEYIRKQTLVSNERYFTPELKELESTLATAGERINQLEYSYFCDVRDQAAAQVERIQQSADECARLDALCSLAETAVRNRYTCPEIDLEGAVDIRDGRHPVVELTQRDALFVPNDSLLNDGDDRLAIITGPNMAGKSTFMRQTALIVLMAQMGSFVPAKSARIGVVDRVFTRIGASDDLSSGRSTFMVEMTEVADILRQATKRSLIILDEVGRGTSTYDGMAIARAVVEYCADKRRLGAKTMFATHYHELTALEGRVQGVRNYNITARKQGDSLIFLRKIVPGGADESYGIQVARLAGVPDAVVDKAAEYLTELEGKRQGKGPRREKRSAPAESQMSLGDELGEEIIRALRETSLEVITPIEAMNLLYELKKKAEV